MFVPGAAVTHCQEARAALAGGAFAPIRRLPKARTASTTHAARVMSPIKLPIRTWPVGMWLRGRISKRAQALQRGRRWIGSYRSPRKVKWDNFPLRPGRTPDRWGQACQPRLRGRRSAVLLNEGQEKNDALWFPVVRRTTASGSLLIASCPREGQNPDAAGRSSRSAARPRERRRSLGGWLLAVGPDLRHHATFGQGFL
jgi:hypothetical protein